MQKKRTYNTCLIKYARSYLFSEIATLFDVHLNAVDRWKKAGMPCIDDQKPRRVRGSDLIAFINARQSARKRPCKLNDLLCCKCRKPQPAWENTVDLIIRDTKRLNITGLCIVCLNKSNRGGSVSKIAEYGKIFNVQTVQGEHLVTGSNPSVMCGLQGS